MDIKLNEIIELAKLTRTEKIKLAKDLLFQTQLDQGPGERDINDDRIKNSYETLYSYETLSGILADEDLKRKSRGEEK